MTHVTRRDSIGCLLNNLGFTRGVEVGVQAGIFTHTVLQSWTRCERYFLVDVWAHQENYKDTANVQDSRHEELYQETLQRLQPWRNVTMVCRNWSSVCAQAFANESMDFVYIDARHDFKGVSEDLRAYWPKVRPGGIFAGHDYIHPWKVKYFSGQNWLLNYDGTVDATGGAVIGAVNEFVETLRPAQRQSFHVTLERWATWMIRK